MATTEFLSHFRPTVLFSRLPRFGTVPESEAEAVETARRFHNTWLHPNALKGFDPSSFSGLTRDQKEELQKHVERFQLIVDQLQPDRHPTYEEVSEARKALAGIDSLVGKELSDEENMAVMKALDRILSPASRPPFIKHVDYQVGNDWSGDPAVWVWFIVDDAEGSLDRIYPSLQGLRRMLTDHLKSLGVSRLVYINFRTESEQAGLLRGADE